VGSGGQGGAGPQGPRLSLLSGPGPGLSRLSLARPPSRACCRFLRARPPTRPPSRPAARPALPHTVARGPQPREMGGVAPACGREAAGEGRQSKGAAAGAGGRDGMGTPAQGSAGGGWAQERGPRRHPPLPRAMPTATPSRASQSHAGPRRGGAGWGRRRRPAAREKGWRCFASHHRRMGRSPFFFVFPPPKAPDHKTHRARRVLTRDAARTGVVLDSSMVAMVVDAVGGGRGEGSEEGFVCRVKKQREE
jgi:hypothetical protein